METSLLTTSFGTFRGKKREHCVSYLGIPYARAGRFEYAVPVDSYGGVFDAIGFGNACTQKRTYFEHLEIPERMFYHREFRDGTEFRHSEDCLNLNIYVPSVKDGKKCPVAVYIHGGGFDSGANSESPFDGDGLAQRGILTVFINYRVGVFGFFAHEEIQKEYGHDGNFGLDDQVKAVEWVKKHISEFGGDEDNITLMGQSAGAMSIQDMILSKKTEGLFQKAVLMSGCGKLPPFNGPRPVEKTRPYWLEVMKACSCTDLSEFRRLDPKVIFTGLEEVKKRRKDSLQNTMVQVDHYYLDSYTSKDFKTVRDIPTVVGFTNNDMVTLIWAKTAMKYGNAHKAYKYCFDVDAKGDKNKAFHSADLRYAFGTLESSWRPYGEEDKKVSSQMMDEFSQFAKTGSPNGEGLPLWTNEKGKVLDITLLGSKMKRPPYGKLFLNTFLGDPK